MCILEALQKGTEGCLGGWLQVCGCLGGKEVLGVHRGSGNPVGPKWPCHQHEDVPLVLCQAVTPGEVLVASLVPLALCELLN